MMMLSGRRRGLTSLSLSLTRLTQRKVLPVTAPWASFSHPTVKATFSTQAMSAATPDWVREACQKMMLEHSSLTPAPSETNHKATTSNTPGVVHNNSSQNSFAAGSAPTLLISDDDLEKSVRSIQNRLEEARLCIADCKTYSEEETDWDEEVSAADQALEQVVAATVEWLDELRTVANASQQSHWASFREQVAGQIKALRAELDQLKKEHDQQEQAPPQAVSQS